MLIVQTFAMPHPLSQYSLWSGIRFGPDLQISGKALHKQVAAIEAVSGISLKDGGDSKSSQWVEPWAVYMDILSIFSDTWPDKQFHTSSWTMADGWMVMELEGMWLENK